uniref:Uncharacterized protein n=1 Tax=Desertifilum tharense IPPAS B-1220 TaxID=1781255 RepID=A0ACD5H2J9_9CYAN
MTESMIGNGNINSGTRHILGVDSIQPEKLYLVYDFKCDRPSCQLFPDLRRDWVGMAIALR